MLKTMIKDSNKREWNYVLVYKFDRFSRNKYETAMHKKTLKDNGVKVISATEYIYAVKTIIVISFLTLTILLWTLIAFYSLI